MTSPLRTGVLLAPFVGIVLIFFAGWAGMAPTLSAVLDTARGGVIEALGWVFSGAALVVIVVMAVAYFALDHIRIGGPDARTGLTTLSAIAVGVAASTSLGLLFWAAAEPIYHAHMPPASMGIAAMSEPAQLFARVATYLHWSITAHALNGLFMVGFGLAAQNTGTRPSLDEVIAGSPGEGLPPRTAGTILDGIIIFFATLATAAALASCVVALSGEMIRFSPFAPNAPGLLALTVAVGFTVMVAAARPIRRFYSTLGKIGLMLMALLITGVVILGPTGDILSGGLHALWQMLLSFPAMMTFTGYESGDPWPQTWTQTHWASWMMLAPLVGMFLSRAARGFTVGEALLLFCVVPALVSILWIAVFGGLALSVDEATRGGIWTAIQRGGADDAAYAALWTLPGGEALVVGFVALVVLSFTTFAAGILHAIMHICAPGEDTLPEVITARRNAATLWCTCFCIAGWGLAISGRGPFIETVARVGGAPALAITLATVFAVVRFCFRPRAVSGTPKRSPVQIDFDLGDAVAPSRRRMTLDEDEPLPRRRKKRKSA